MSDLEVRALRAVDANDVAEMFSRCSAGYLQHFHPFSFERDALRSMLAIASRDRYWGIRANGELAGMFMLRGFDEGYTVPAFGVVIGERFAARGLLNLALQYVDAWCRLNDVSRIMLKVHPDNTRARRAYEAWGYVLDRVDAASQNLVLYRSLIERVR